MEKEKVVFIATPALVVLLTRYERDKGKPLTYDEVIDICENAIGIASPESMIEEIAESRAYNDLNPNNIWEDWLPYRDSDIET